MLLLPLTAAADNSDDGEASLTVKPLLCIVDQRTPSCDMRFLITWQCHETGYYCYNSEVDSAALRGGDEARSRQDEEDRKDSETFG